MLPKTQSGRFLANKLHFVKLSPLSFLKLPLAMLLPIVQTEVWVEANTCPDGWVVGG